MEHLIINYCDMQVGLRNKLLRILSSEKDHHNVVVIGLVLLLFLKKSVYNGIRKIVCEICDSSYSCVSMQSAID